MRDERTLYRKTDGLQITTHLRQRGYWYVTAAVGPNGESFGWIEASRRDYVGSVRAAFYRRRWDARYREGLERSRRGGIVVWRCLAMSTVPPWR